MPWLAEEVVWPWLPEEGFCWAKEGLTAPMIKAMDTAISHSDDMVRMHPNPSVAQHPSSLATSQLRPRKSSEQLVGALSILNVLRLCHTNGHNFTASAPADFGPFGLQGSL